MVDIYIRFNSAGQHNGWENARRSQLNMPIIGNRASDGVPQPNKQQTVRYTEFIPHPNAGAVPPNLNVLVIADERAIGTTPPGTVITEQEAIDDGFFPEIAP